MHSQITTISRGSREGAWRIFAVSTGQLALCRFALPTVSDDANGGRGSEETPSRPGSQQSGGTPVLLDSQSANGRDHANGVASARFTMDFRKRAGSSFDTILNHGLARTRTYLAISQSQCPIWLSRTTHAAGPGLNLTSSSSEVSSATQSEIASAGPVAGAGGPAPAGVSSWVGSDRRADRSIDPTRRARRSRPTTDSGAAHPITAWRWIRSNFSCRTRQPEVLIA